MDDYEDDIYNDDEDYEFETDVNDAGENLPSTRSPIREGEESTTDKMDELNPDYSDNDGYEDETFEDSVNDELNGRQIRRNSVQMNKEAAVATSKLQEPYEEKEFAIESKNYTNINEIEDDGFGAYEKSMNPDDNVDDGFIQLDNGEDEPENVTTAADNADAEVDGEDDTLNLEGMELEEYMLTHMPEPEPIANADGGSEDPDGGKKSSKIDPMFRPLDGLTPEPGQSRSRCASTPVDTSRSPRNARFSPLRSARDEMETGSHHSKYATTPGKRQLSKESADTVAFGSPYQPPHVSHDSSSGRKMSGLSIVASPPASARRGNAPLPIGPGGQTESLNKILKQMAKVQSELDQLTEQKSREEERVGFSVDQPPLRVLTNEHDEDRHPLAIDVLLKGLDLNALAKHARTKSHGPPSVSSQNSFKHKPQSLAHHQSKGRLNVASITSQTLYKDERRETPSDLADSPEGSHASPSLSLEEQIAALKRDLRRKDDRLLRSEDQCAVLANACLDLKKQVAGLQKIVRTQEAELLSKDMRVRDPASKAKKHGLAAGKDKTGRIEALQERCAEMVLALKEMKRREATLLEEVTELSNKNDTLLAQLKRSVMRENGAKAYLGSNVSVHSSSKKKRSDGQLPAKSSARDRDAVPESPSSAKKWARPPEGHQARGIALDILQGPEADRDMGVGRIARERRSAREEVTGGSAQHAHPMTENLKGARSKSTEQRTTLQRLPAVDIRKR